MKVKRTMAAILILMLLFAMLLTACGGTKPEDVTEMYSSSSELTDSENRLGIDISGIAKVFSQQTVHVTFSNEMAFVGDNIELLAQRFTAYNAENAKEEIELTHIANSSGIVLAFPEDIQCKYVLVMFFGIPEDEVESISTPTCGFLVQLDKKGTSKLAGPFLLDEVSD